MNDFTKEDLEDLSNCITCYSSTSDHNFGDTLYPELLIKVQDMIYNYCEHDQGFESDSMMVDTCKKCNRNV